MSKWLTHAKLHFSDIAQDAAPITPEIDVMGVLVVSSEQLATNEDCLSVVLVAANHRLELREVQDCSPENLSEAEDALMDCRLRRMAMHDFGAESAEGLVQRLLVRDREQDDRKCCFDCAHLGIGNRCKNWKAAGISLNHRDTSLPADLTLMLQRCDGFRQYPYEGSLQAWASVMRDSIRT